MPRMPGDGRRRSDDSRNTAQAEAARVGAVGTRPEGADSDRAALLGRLDWIAFLLEELCYQQTGYHQDRDDYIAGRHRQFLRQQRGD